ncbi:MAG: transposase, partial [Bulleidia sp.]
MDDQELREIKARAEAGVMGKNELRECLCDVIDMVLELRCAASERVRADEAEKQNVARLKARVESLLKDYLSTQEALTLVLDQLKLNNRSLYDTSTESMNELAKRIIRCTRRYFDSTAATDHESPAGPAGQTGTPEYDNQDSTSDIRTIIANLTADPVDEDADPDPGPEPGQSSGQEGKNAAAASAGDSTGGTKNLFFDPADPAATAAGREKKGQGKRPVDFQAWMDGLIHRCHFVIHPDKYDARFGKGGWHIDNWVACNSLQIIPAQLYVDTVYRPVIAPNDLSREKYFDKAGDAVCGSGKLRSGAWSSPSLVAYLIDMKFENSTALYAIEKYFQYRNTPLKRGWMTGWINEAAHCYLGPVVEYMHRLLLSECCTQCDETPWEVICDGRGPGSKSYFWVHTSSELMDGHRK